ncbi:MAG: HEAT repeat domain-containing protein [Deltaproteobacteria bacterium]|nr:HEAT repeat domain-containing protein [Deltaproteobacteria bacterium]
MPTGRETKRRVLDILGGEDWESGLDTILALPAQSVIGPLFSALCASSPAIRWHAITAFGLVLAGMAKATPEKARIVMRRFIWSLNDESGGIGWGAPEAMAEIVCQSPLLASEYHNHVLAYIHEDHCRPDCYLEHAPLRRGAIWGVGRMAQVRPDLAIKAEADLLRALTDCDAPIRGLAAWACGHLGLTSALPGIKAMTDDHTPMELYQDRHLWQTTPATLAREAMTRITGARPAND